jgi:hypothetical protein
MQHLLTTLFWIAVVLLLVFVLVGGWPHPVHA